jgi:peptidyl-prolyl cis-trans isomerase C
MQTKHTRQVFAIVMALAMALVFSLAVAGEKDPAQDKVAVVNGSVITRAEFDREVRAAEQRITMRGKSLSDSQQETVRKETLARLIERELLYQESQKKGVKVDEASLDAKFKKQFPNEAEFKKILSNMNMTEADLRTRFIKGMAIRQFVDKEFLQKATVTDKEAKKYYDSHPDAFKQPEQVRASHILIKVDSKTDKSKKAEARKTIEEIQQKLKKGGDFAALAKEFSQCPSSAKGGDLGYFKRGKMVKPFEEAAFSLKPGEISDIVETQFGYHLIKVLDKKPESTMPYKEAKNKIEQRLKREKAQKELSSYIAKLQEKGKVETFLEETPHK